MIYNTSKRFLPIYKSGPPGPDFDNMPLTYKALSNGTNNIRLSGSGSNWAYKLNDNQWQSYTNNTQIDLSTSGDIVLFSGSCNNPIVSRGTGNLEVCGNLSSVVGSVELTANKQLSAMFSGQTCLTHASGLIIPCLSSAPSGMRHMFSNCTNMVTAPQVRTNSWGNHGAAAMFSGCTSLTSITMDWSYTTDNYALQKIFRGCTGIRKLRILGPTTVQTWPSYANNFNVWLEQTSGAVVQCAEVEWTSWPKATYDGVEYYFDKQSTHPFLNGVTNNNQYGIFIGPASLDNTYKPSNWTRITKDNGVMILSSTNRSEYSSKLNSIVTDLVWNDSTNHYDLIFAD